MLILTNAYVVTISSLFIVKFHWYFILFMI